jgi:phage terminase large subunit
MRVDLKLTPRQIDFLEASYKYPVCFFGGAKGGGKSHGLRTICLIRALETAGLKAGIFRRSHPELLANHIRTLLHEHPWLLKLYNKQEHLITLPNGGTIEFCYCDSEDDVLRYQGREFHLLAIDEAGQWPEAMFWTLLGSNRSSDAGIKSVCLLTGNPGGIGHTWLKRLFVDRNYRHAEREEDYFYIQSLIYDCSPLMDADPGYLRRLEAEPNETLRRAYLHGDWTVFAGQFFSEFDLHVHVLPMDWKPMDHWPMYLSHDPGHYHPCVWHLWTVDEDGCVYCVREIVKRGAALDEQAGMVWQWPEAPRVVSGIGGKDCWAKGREGSPCIAEQLALVKPRPIYLAPANTDRVQGAAQVRAYLAVRGGKTRLLIHPRCKRTIECLPRLIHDPGRPEDVLKVDSTDSDPYGGDDTYDSLRYFVMSRPRASASDPDQEFVPFTQRRARLAKLTKLKMGRNDDVLGNKF